jgi:hypothetical protein
MYQLLKSALDISSCGDTDKDARRNIRDAVRGFLATSADMGTLGEILEEAGYRQEGSIGWLHAGFPPASLFR